LFSGGSRFGRGLEAAEAAGVAGKAGYEVVPAVAEGGASWTGHWVGVAELRPAVPRRNAARRGPRCAGPISRKPPGGDPHSAARPAVGSAGRTDGAGATAVVSAATRRFGR